MNSDEFSISEQDAAVAFNKQSTLFDELYKNNSIVQYKRDRVRDHLELYLQPESHILELNAGTGDDAIYFALKGHTIHATDISEGMKKVAEEKISALQLTEKINYEMCSFNKLGSIVNKGPYDYIFSNFGGLNCTQELRNVISSFSKLLKPNGYVTLVIMPGFCLWESLLFLKGEYKIAFRRFPKKGSRAHIEGTYFTCYYYSPAKLIKYFSTNYQLLNLQGLCTIMPPSYMEHFAEKNPAIYSWLKKKENKYKDKWPWRSIGDYFIITFRLKN